MAEVKKPETDKKKKKYVGVVERMWENITRLMVMSENTVFLSVEI